MTKEKPEVWCYAYSRREGFNDKGVESIQRIKNGETPRSGFWEGAVHEVKPHHADGYIPCSRYALHALPAPVRDWQYAAGVSGYPDLWLCRGVPEGVHGTKLVLSKRTVCRRITGDDPEPPPIDKRFLPWVASTLILNRSYLGYAFSQFEVHKAHFVTLLLDGLRWTTKAKKQRVPGVEELDPYYGAIGSVPLTFEPGRWTGREVRDEIMKGQPKGTRIAPFRVRDFAYQALSSVFRERLETHLEESVMDCVVSPRGRMTIETDVGNFVIDNVFKSFMDEAHIIREAILWRRSKDQ